MIDEKVVNTYVRSSKSSFYLAMLAFPRERRRAIMIVYAFCRFTDDMVDRAIPDVNPVAFLDNWRKEFDKGVLGKSDYLLLNHLGSVCRDYSIPSSLFHDLIDGFEMDLDKTTYQTFSELYEYCYRVASTVGLIVMRLLDNRDPALQAYAINAGIGVQLTNIIRDVATDQQRGRVYIPTEELREEGLMISSWLEEEEEALTRLLMKQCARARSFYDAADRIYEEQQPTGLYPARSMQNLYRALLRKMEYRIEDIPQRKVRLSSIEKVRVLAKTWIQESFREY